MKLPILHSLEKKIRHSRRLGKLGSQSSKHKETIKPLLDPVETEQSDSGYQQPKISRTPLVSIIIPVYNQFDYTRKCLNSIARNTSEGIPYEIILIDDNSSDETVEISKYYPGITVHRNQVNQGFLRNVNFAATVAQGEFIHLLNNDTIVTPGWLQSMLNVFDCYDSVGAVGSKLTFPNGMIQEAGGYITSDGHFGNFGRSQNILEPKYNYIREVDYVSGASLLINKKLWNQLGGFDEMYLPAYFEDTDLAMRIRKAGFKVMYQPKSVVFHFESISYSRQEASSKAMQMEKNKKLFLANWDIEIRKTHKTRHDGFRFYERNMHEKPAILYIDSEVPNDYSCGSKLSLNYCKLLSDMGYAIKYLPMQSSPTIIEDIASLGQLGIEVLSEYDKKGNLIRYNKSHINCFRNWLKKNHNNIDYYLLARPSSYNYLKLIRSVVPNASFFYHPADLHFLRHERSQVFLKKEPALRGYRRRLRMAKKKAQELALLRQADKVLHVSTLEQEYLKTHYDLKNGIIIPCLFFNKISNFRAVPSQLSDLMFIGGRHSASIDGIKWCIESVFPQVLKAHPDTKLHIIGDCGKYISAAKNVVVHGRLPENKVIEFYQKTIVIVPLRFGSGVKGKTLEAMYHGSPFVSTMIGLEGIPDIEQVIYSCDTDETFSAKIIQIINDPSLFTDNVHACQKIINSRFTRHAARVQLRTVFPNNEQL